MARIELPSGEIIEGRLLSDPVEPQEEPVSAPANRPRPEDTAKQVPAAPPPSLDTVDALDELERAARNEHQNALDAAQALRNDADRGAWQRTVDVADAALNAVLADLSTRKRSLQL